VGVPVVRTWLGRVVDCAGCGVVAAGAFSDLAAAEIADGHRAAHREGRAPAPHGSVYWPEGSAR
jgi:hypothetical protein